VPAHAPPPPPIIEKRPAELVRSLMVRRFVSTYLKTMNAAEALREVKPHVSKAASRAVAYDLLHCADVQAELMRQVRGIETHAHVDEEYVYRFWQAMATASIFNYLDVDPVTGQVRWKLDPNALTAEQRLMIREIRIDPRSGQVVHLKLVDLEGTIANIAKAKKMFSLLENDGLEHVVKDIQERMQRASRTVRTFDHEASDEDEEQ
jgi:hypothetical protein